MARRFEIVPAEFDHVELVAADLRECDRQEIDAACGEDPREVLLTGLRASTLVWTAFARGQAMCMFGVTPASMLGSIGVPWLLATNVIDDDNATRFLRNSKPYLQRMHSAYNHLVNYVDNRNVKAIEWLTWLGFEMGEPEPYGVKGLPFRRFEMRA